MINDSDVLFHIAASNRFKGINIDSGIKLELKEVEKENVEKRMKSFFLPNLIGQKEHKINDKIMTLKSEKCLNKIKNSE